MTFENVSALAIEFLNIAKKYNENVSNYINGSNAQEDLNAYAIVKKAYRAFIDAVNKFEGERYDYALDYELAEAYI